MPADGSQYWLGATGVPAWWRTRVQGQPGWLVAEAVDITDVPNAATFLARWEDRIGPASWSVRDSARLCERSVPARYLILKTLTRGWHEPLSCVQVTRAQLASLVQLDGVLDYSTHPPQTGDLADLSALEEVQIRVGARPLPPAFLPSGRYRRVRLLSTEPRVLARDGWAAGAQVERLLIQGGDWSESVEPRIVHDFILDGTLQEVLPPNLLQNMDLRRLHLNLPAAAALPGSLLAKHQDLQELQLRIRIPFESFQIQVADRLILDAGLSNESLPARLLQEVPNLELLHLDVPNRPLPATLLTGLSRLKVLRLRSDLQQALQLDWTTLRQLEVLELLDTNIAPVYMPTPAQQRAGEPLVVPPDWLWSLPELRVLRLNSKRVRLVPPDWLARSPRLEVVELGGTNWKGLTNLCLEGLPRLRQLHLNWSAPLTAHGNTAWRQDSYEPPRLPESTLLVEPVLDEPCQTWTELAVLRYLHRNRDFQAAARDAPNVVWPSHPEQQWERTTHRDEVAKTLRLRYAVAPPPDILFDPGLRPTVLQLSDPGLTTLPDTFPGQADQLRTLTLNLPGLTVLPDTFLEQADRLRTLTLDLPGLTVLPDTFLAHLATLSIATSGKYPNNHNVWLYWRYPELRFQPSLTLTLHTPRLTALPEHLLNGPGVNLEYRGRYPDDDAPRPDDGSHNTYLELALDGAMNSSEVRLTQEAGLTHLSLETAQLTALPDGFLNQAPALTHLTLELPQLTALPDGFLNQAPALTHLTLELPQLTALPDGFLNQAPALTHLTLELPQLTALPDGFLERSAQLQSLRLLNVHALQQLPPLFLAHMPNLQEVHLTDAFVLQALPTAFLARAPRLRELIVEAWLRKLHTHFLADSPWLDQLVLKVENAGSLPGPTPQEALQPPPRGCANTGDCITFPHSMPLEPLNYLCTWGEKILLHKESSCIGLPYINFYVLSCHSLTDCAHWLEDDLYGPWRMICYRDPTGFLRCSPRLIGSQASTNGCANGSNTTAAAGCP